jgi:hypothetical protein
MSREQSMPLRLLERLEQVLIEDYSTNPELWAVTPQTVATEITAELDGKPEPVVAFELVESTEQEEEGSVSDGGPVGRDLAQVTGWLWTTDPARPQAAILELASDFKRFLLRHRQLEAADGEAWLECGRIRNIAISVATNFEAASAGAGLAEVTFQIDYSWTSTTA